MELLQKLFDYQNGKERSRNVARRLSQTRTVALDGFYRSTSVTSKADIDSSVSSKNRKNSELYFRPVLEERAVLPDQIKLPEKIKEWMFHTQFEGMDDEKINSHSAPVTPHSANSDIICDPFYRSNNDNNNNTNNEAVIPGFKNNDCFGLSAELKSESCKSSAVLCDVKWGVENCDLLLEVEDMLIPVEKNFICYVSDTFHNLTRETESDDLSQQMGCVVKLHNYTYNEVKMVLEFIYSVSDVAICDENVASLLQLGDEFKAERLVTVCEKYLRDSTTFNPVIMSHLAKRYNLNSLLEYAYAEMSKIDGIEDTQEFQLLDAIAQNQILKFILKRYQKASRTLSQFDVHLCSHHGEDAKNNDCCFRAATYSTENERTFLVRMEEPDKKLIDRYENAFTCETESLLDEGKNQQKSHMRLATM